MKGLLKTVENMVYRLRSERHKNELHKKSDKPKIIATAYGREEKLKEAEEHIQRALEALQEANNIKF